MQLLGSTHATPAGAGVGVGFRMTGSYGAGATITDTHPTPPADTNTTLNVSFSQCLYCLRRKTGLFCGNIEVKTKNIYIGRHAFESLCIVYNPRYRWQHCEQQHTSLKVYATKHSPATQGYIQTTDSEFS